MKTNHLARYPFGSHRLIGSVLVCLISVETQTSYGQQNIVYPAGAKAIVDVTKPPYNADKTGRTDCTDALNRAYDDLLRPVLAGQLETVQVLAAHPDTLIGQESGAARYGLAVRRPGNGSIAGPFLTEYVSGGVQTLFAGQPARSLRLPVAETPAAAWEANANQWVSVNAFGAKGDGKTNDTQAIQQALNSGKPVVYFNPGQYLIDGTVLIPATVNRLNFMFADLKMGVHLKEQVGRSVFNVVGQSTKPLVMETLFAWEEFVGEPYLIDHATTRTLILKELQTQTAALYKNSVPGGKVFIENVACTKNYGTRNCFHFNCFYFTGQRIWARQLNPERADPEVRNDGSTLWVLGFKTESNGTSFATCNGGKTEVLGGVVNNYNPTIPADKPIVFTDNSSVSFVGVTNGQSNAGKYFQTMAVEKRGTVTKTLEWSKVPRRYENQRIIPLYVGYH